MIRSIKRDCYFYTWGGSIEKGFTTYPREFGARCELKNKFFGDYSFNIKSCTKCKDYNNTLKT